jgi:hypothetical protein
MVAQPPRVGPVHAYKTFQVLSPIETHFEETTCDQVECKAHVNGWQSFIDEGTEQGQQQAHYIRRQSGRGFSEDRNEAGMTVFTFGAGQECFATHQQKTDRPQHFLLHNGRRDPYLFDRPDQWVDDFAGHQDQLAARLNKG